MDKSGLLLCFNQKKGKTFLWEFRCVQSLEGVDLKGGEDAELGPEPAKDATPVGRPTERRHFLRIRAG